MKIVRQWTVILLACLVSMGASGDIALAPDPPFKTYSIADGLNQKSALAIAQDDNGFLWIATFGGLNRFDGINFESITTRQGLRDNFIHELYVDSQNRVWAGDAAGGVTILENGRVVRTVEPPPEHPGTARDMLEFNGSLYVGTEPGGLRRVSMSAPADAVEFVTDAPGTVHSMVALSDTEMLVLGTNGLFRFQPANDDQIVLLSNDITGLAGDQKKGIFVGNSEGQVGHWTQHGIEWLATRYDAPVQRFGFDGNELKWVFTAEHFSPFEQPEIRLNTDRIAQTLVDAEGLLWIPSGTGLERYLGPRFSHYSLEIDGARPSVFSIQPGANNDYWFGSENGLLHVDADGRLTNVSIALGIPINVVREVKLADDKKTLWVSHITDVVYRVDTQAMTATPVFPAESTVTVGLEIDHFGRVWAGTYFGNLFAHDPADGTTRELNLGEGAAIYALAVAPDGWLWFTVNFKGVYRIDTAVPDAEPELVISTDDIGRTLFTDLVVAATGPQDDNIWFTTTQGGVFRWANGELSQVIDDPVISDLAMYTIVPLPDDTIVLTTNRGVYRYDLNEKYLEHYGPLDGFVAIEGKAHASYLESDNTLWLGAGSGVTKMDPSLPFERPSPPRPQITRLQIDDEPYVANVGQSFEVNDGKFLIEYAAISTRAPQGIEYSYMLAGIDTTWSTPTLNRSIGYSNLGPGSYEFQLRARRAGGEWSAADRRSFNVPTPFWRTYWFMALALLFGVLATRGIIQLRLRSIARANRRLREQVLERTRSLEQTNAQLSTEIQERHKSDALRADVEARFHQAYQNSPIGMALVDVDGLVYDANPRLKKLFWPNSKREDKEPLIEVIAHDDRARFDAFLDAFAMDELAEPSMEFACRASNGATRRIDFLPSAVRDDTGQLQYIVLLANDVTESRAMTTQLEYQASFDELTGLVNRRAYTSKLEAIGETSAEVGNAYLMFMDLDQFKIVNDTCGHAAGDELLRQVARLIEENVRDGDTVARLGGDEFALILLGCTERIALDRAECIRKAIQDLEFFWESEIFRIGVSIGVVPFGLATQDLNELQQLADAACYAAKDAGRNRVHLVAGEQDAAVEHRGEMRWVQRLNHAIDTNSFVLFGQRIESLNEGTAKHERIEVLLRMHDRVADRLIPPGAFLPAAERYGLQGKLDQWVVQRVIGVLTAQDPAELARRRFWVNLSGASVNDDDFSRKLIETVATCGVPPGTLNFEITETTMIRKIGAAAKLVESLQDMGCKVALDDFGSGLSSFSYLKRLNVDLLKVDGEFVRDIATDPTDRIFVKSIIDIAHTLGMQVVAEFVENDEVLATVRDLGTDFAQGFGVHRPQPLEELVPVVRRMLQSGG